MSTQVSFYHLERQGLEAALPRLLEKVLGAGHKVVVFLGSQARMASLDTALWTYDAASFLPHGCEGGAHVDLQPVYLAQAHDVPNGADVLVMLDANVPPDVTIFARCLYMFDAREEGATQQARKDWIVFKEAGYDLTYWQQNEQGKWEKKA